MLKQLFLLFLLTSSFCVFAQEYQQEDVKTRVRFKIKNFGVNVDGQFGDVQIQVTLDSLNPENSSINASIAVGSIRTGIESRDEHILEEDYFNETKYKTIDLESTKLEFIEGNQYNLHADLTIKGITKSLKIPMTIQTQEEIITIKANFQINRKDYEVGGGSLIMSKKVKVEVLYTGTKSS